MGTGIDFTNAALVIAAVYGLVELAKSVVPKIKTDNRLTTLTVVVSGQAAVWGLATTVWAHTQVIGGQNLDNLNAGSKVAAGLFFAFAAPFLDKGLDAIGNIGENRVKPVDPRKLV